MNEFDQFVKHTLRVKHYARYTDDFLIVSENKKYLENLLPHISYFLLDRLALTLHPNKVSIRTYKQGIDFLGYVCLPNHIRVRGKTYKRILKKLEYKTKSCQDGDIPEETLEASINSYLGVLAHANAYEKAEDIRNKVWFWKTNK